MAVALSSGERVVLLNCPLLRGGEEELIQRVLSLPGVWRREFSPGQTLYSPDHFLRCLGVLLSGRAGVSSGTLSVSVLEPGSLFGAAALFGDVDQFATTITARTSCQVLFLPQEELDTLLEREPLVRRNYLGYLTGRIRFLSGRLQSVTQSGAEAKLARYLLANHQGGQLQTSATDLAKRLGVSRASLYRAFEDLEREDLIHRQGKTILIPSLSALESLLQSPT